MPHDEQGWLCQEIEGASVGDGTENIGGCQNADRVTGVVENRNRVDLFIEHGVGDLSDLRHGSGGQDPAIHDTCKFAFGEWSRRIDGFQFMRVGQ
jgi:hypothetical protein